MNEQENRDGQPDSAGSPEGGEDKEHMVAEHEAVAGSSYQYGVGDELRMRREAMGKSISDVVEAVRIQRRYIEALEENRLDGLPGTVYALGFVRTYADFLGLNGAEMVSRFKDESDNLQKQVYVMPEPIEEGKVPTAAIFVLGLVLAAVAYGVWYYLSNKDSAVVQNVPEVPAHLETATPKPAPIETPQTATTAEGDQPPIAEAPAETPAPAPTPVAEAPVETPAPAPTPVAEAPVETPTPTPAPVVETSALPPIGTAPLPSAVETVALAPPEAGSVGLETTGGTETALVAEEVPAAPAVEEEPREPRIYGQTNVDARIVITATEDAWVEVSDVDEARIFSRVLRAGDVYRVPVRDGMTFVTGNAGGLQITVDGEVVPALGPAGQVRRNVKLDASLLKSGNAWP